jgi:protocatechuate 3,4-dioxygenase beta subunit
MLIFAMCIALSSLTAFAQEPTGGIEGSITDPQGAVVQGATVTVRNTATNLTRTATTGDNGQYRLSQLPPGMYEVKVACREL